ncbi:activating signal cointegrator 1 complex subunit 1, partial [Homo sapiens]
MEVLRPQLIRIDGRNYRKNPVQEQTYQHEEDEEDFYQVITGQHRNGVISARTRIDVLLDTFRRKQPFTHFLAFFLNEVEVQEGFLRFQEEVLAKCSMDHGVDSSIFQNPKKLHLTIGMLVLLSEEEIQQTCEMLQQCKE